MSEETVSLVELVEKCLEFRDNPTSEAYEEITKTINAIDVRERLSLAEKGVCLMRVLGSIQDNESPLECAFAETAGFFFNCTLAYASNLKRDLPLSMENIEVYDLLTTFGLEDRILSFCGKDHATSRKMLDDAVNFSNLFKLAESVKLVSPEGVAELDKVLKGIKEELTLDKIRGIKSILAEGDPAWKSLKESVGEDIAFSTMANEASDLEKALDSLEETKKEIKHEPKDSE